MCLLVVCDTDLSVCCLYDRSVLGQTSISQSVMCPLTTKDIVTLAGSVTSDRRKGMGSIKTTYRHVFSHNAWTEVCIIEESYTNCSVNVLLCNSMSSQCIQYGCNRSVIPSTCYEVKINSDMLNELNCYISISVVNGKLHFISFR